MGPRATRIVSEDLLIPAEFAGLGLTSHPAARVGGARIELVRQGDQTRMGASYQQVPVRFMPPFSFSGEPAALLYLINLTAGLMDGDGHCIDVVARSGTRALVTGQSATRVHPALKSFSSQQWNVQVEDDACLVVLPGPTIPYQGARYYQRGRVELAPGARMIWGDIWLPGRYERGSISERFVFDRIVQDFEVYRSGRLIYRDRFRWEGPWDAEQAEWHFGPSLCAASLFAAGPVPETLHEPPPGVVRSVMPLEGGDTCMRWCGEPAAVVEDLVHVALRLAADWTVGPDAPPWLLTSTDLAPNHWFSARRGVRNEAGVRI